MEIGYSYLSEQFSNPDPILEDIKKLVFSGDFTLGKPMRDFELKFAQICQTKYAIGVGSGTDAIRLSLIALGIKEGDEVITTPNTFFATIGAIATVGAKPVFVDVGVDNLINPDLIEQAITPKTKAILPVHWHGCPANMDRINEIAQKHNLFVVEDACMAMGAQIREKRAGSFGNTGCFSLHPLKPINVWGDGGIITTDSEELKDKLLLLRNHGLVNRDECQFYAFNSRLDPLHAVVGNHLIKDFDWIIQTKIRNANLYDEELSKISEIVIPPRNKEVKSVYHNYTIFAKNRDQLLDYLIKKGVDAKIHYPIPMHLQEASNYLGYKEGDFPQAEYFCKNIISLPVHQHLSEEKIKFVIEKVKGFYNESN